MLFDLDDKDECISKERALSIFKKSEDTGTDMYTVKITNMKQFRLALKYISLGSSFSLAMKIFQVTKGEVNIGYLGSLNVPKIVGYIRI